MNITNQKAQFKLKSLEWSSISTLLMIHTLMMKCLFSAEMFGERRARSEIYQAIHKLKLPTLFLEETNLDLGKYLNLINHMM